ncbi:MAG: GntR family transcriptional regulator [Treponema sp.]|jgi:GntR family transcriptional regulator|nr:GntR family transcriptional regulator [Treponema sp.]
MNSTKPESRNGQGRQPAVSFSLENDNGIPIYRQIINQIEYAILSKRMAPGDRLPTIRSLAVELKTNPNTIAKAYGELEIRGILVTQVGSGTFISDKKPETGSGRKQKINEIVERFIVQMKALGVCKKELMDLVKGGFDEAHTR